MEENKNSIAGFEVYDSPDALAAAMTAEPQTETVTEEAPQEEPQVVSEPTEPTPVEPQAESVPAPEVQEPVSEQVPLLIQKNIVSRTWRKRLSHT